MQALRDAMSQISAKNAVVFGISTDSVESHKGFAAKESLNFPLLADVGGKMSEAYGVLQPNGMSARVTFVVGPDGKIAHVDRAVNSQFYREGATLKSRHAEGLALGLSDWRAKIGSPVPPFSLLGIDGRTFAAPALGKKATVVVFLSAKSSVSRAYDQRLAGLSKDPAYKDVAFVGLNSNSDEGIDDVKKHAEGQGIPFVVGKDMVGKLADHFGARLTPTVWVLDAKGVAVYSGSIDDNQNAAMVKSSYLKDALDAVLAGTPVATAEAKPFGSPIRRLPRRR